MKKHMTMCERKKCGICGVFVNHSSLPRHIKGVHAGTEEAKELVRKALRYKEVGSTGRPRNKGKRRKNEETCDRCGKRVLPKNMERHMRNIHENRPKAGKNGGREKTPSGVSEQVDARDADEVMTTADGIPAVTKGESASGSASSEEEKRKAQAVAEIWRLYRESPEKCRLCNYKGNEAEMTSHLMNTHVTPTKETTSNLT